jgi:cytochrome c oxidase subunit 2
MPGAVRRATATLILAAASTLTLAAVALAGSNNGGLTPQSSSSPNARGITHSYLVVGIVALAILILVEGLLILFVIRFRRRGRAREVEGPQIHGSHRLELIWTVVPAVLLAIIAGFVLATLPGVQDVPAANANGGRIDVTVEGHQFYWQFVYPNGAISYDEMVVPAGSNVKLTVVTPPNDVIHSWWIPELGGKIDAIPGRTNHTWFRTPKYGTYIGQCAEFCGLLHAEMKQSVRSVGRDTYAAFVDRQKQLLDSSSPQLGKQEWDAVCAKCHRIDPASEKLVGPNLGGNPTLGQRDALADIVRNGRGQMPPVGSGWSDEQVDALVAYTKTILKGGSGGSQG